MRRFSLILGTVVLMIALSGIAVADDKPRYVQGVPGIWYVLSGHNDSVSYRGTTVYGHDQNVNDKVCFKPGCDGAIVTDPFATPNAVPYVLIPAAQTTATSTAAAQAAAPAAPARQATAPAAAPRAAAPAAPAAAAPKPKTLPSTSTAFPSDPGEPIN